MSKTIALSLVLAASLGLAACSKSDTGNAEMAADNAMNAAGNMMNSSANAMSNAANATTNAANAK